MAIIRILIILFFSASLWASSNVHPWYSLSRDNQATINVELFLSSTCPHCIKEGEFFKQIQPKLPWLSIKFNYINEDKHALLLFSQFLRQEQANDFIVPSVFFCNSRWLGFESATTTGRDLFEAMSYCKQQIEKKGTLDAATVKVLKRLGNANMYNSGFIKKPTDTQFVLLTVFLDAFNPCALFGLIAFFALLFIQFSRKNQLITGLLFILALALGHFYQQVAMNSFYQMIPWLRIAALLVGLFTLYLAFSYYKAKPPKPLVLYLWAFIIALVVYSYQQTCVMNWSYIFQQWLLTKPLTANERGLYQVVYQLLYPVPLLITLFAYLFFSNSAWMTRNKPFFNIMGLMSISIIGIILLLEPNLLSYLSLSYLGVLLIPLLSFVILKYKKANN